MMMRVLLILLLAGSAMAQTRVFQVSGPTVFQGTFLSGGAGSPELVDFTGTNGLVAHWRLNEESGTRDDAHSTNDLTEFGAGGVGFTAGKLGNAANIITTNFLFNAVTNGVLQMNHEDFTLAAWVKPFTNTLTSTPTVVAGKGTHAIGEYMLHLLTGASPEIARLDALIGSTSFSTNLVSESWNFVIIWHDFDEAAGGNGSVGIQLNGGTPMTKTYNSGITPSTNIFRIGYTRPFVSATNNMDIDSVSLWRRVITATERDRLYTSGAGRDYPFN
jgi:hypothetical protein